MQWLCSSSYKNVHLHRAVISFQLLYTCSGKCRAEQLYPCNADFHVESYNNWLEWGLQFDECELTAEIHLWTEI